MNGKRKQIHKKLPKTVSYTLLGLAFTIILILILFYPMVFSRSDRAAVIRIPAYATRQNVSDTLSKYYNDTFASHVLRLSSFVHADLAARHGSYEIPVGANPLTVVRRIARGGQTPVRLTINNIRNIDTLCVRIASRMEFTPESLREALADSTNLKPYGLSPQQALALFLDDTYEIYWTATPGELIKKIGDNYQSFWNDNNRLKAEALGVSPAGAMILASLAEEETSVNSEKGTIGRLYANRLKKKMRLQSDPTVRFALNDYTIKRVTRKHLAIDSPYNTYRNFGLPPGPIRTTSRATLNSILNSAPNNYLYMCAKEDFSGTHRFASTFEEHSHNARMYQKALNERGIH